VPKSVPLAPEFQIFIRNNTSLGNDIYGFWSEASMPLPDGTPVGTMYWTLKDHDGLALSSDQLPLQAPLINEWEENIIGIGGGTRLEAFGITGHVTSAVVIPEPCTLLFLGIGSIAIIRRVTK